MAQRAIILKNAAAILAVAFSFFLYVLAFEPFDCAEFAYVFAVPAILAARYLCGKDGDLKDAISAKTESKYADKEYARELQKYGLSAPCIACAAESEKIRRKVDVIEEKENIARGKKIWLITTSVCSWVGWAAILIWLRHVYPPAGWAAVVLLPLVIGIGFIFPWFALLPKMLPDLKDSQGRRILALLGISSLWVLLEWLRSWIFTGFPWLLLAHSQWARPAVIQTAEFGGAWIVSFTLIFFNLAIAEYIYRLYVRQRFKIANRFAKNSPIPKFAPDFYIALLLAMLGVWIYITELPRAENQYTAFRAGMIQTDFAGILKWDNQLANANLQTVKRLTQGLAKIGKPDVILWPEAATPPRWPIIGSPDMRALVEKLSRETNTPLLIGNMAYFFDGNYAQNAAMAISPTSGLNEDFYAKRKLVPFGEYTPAWASFIGKVVPVGSLKSGNKDTPIVLKIKDKDYKIGAMICYEDIFPSLGRQMANNGADILFVCTNDSWYGREGGAWQHAAHSAFQAVATRKPLLRSSNNGLTTVFDQYGRMSIFTTLKNDDNSAWDASNPMPSPELEIKDTRGVALDRNTLKPKRATPMLDENNSIYFRGAGFTDVVFYRNFDNVKTFYVKYGDWFVCLCGILALASFVSERRKKA